MLTGPFSFLGSERLQLKGGTTHEYSRNPDTSTLIPTYAGTSECKGFRKEGDPGYDEFGEDDRADESQNEGLHRHIDDCNNEALFVYDEATFNAGLTELLVEDGENVVCGICEVDFTTGGLLVEHLRGCTGSACDECHAATQEISSRKSRLSRC